MKELFFSFLLGLGFTIVACTFNTFSSIFVSALGGLPLAAVAYWRLSYVGKAELGVGKHAAVYMLGWFSIFLAVILPLLNSTMGAVMIYASWGLAAALACLCYKYRSRLAVVVVASLVVWWFFVTAVLPLWSRYLLSVPDEVRDRLIFFG